MITKDEKKSHIANLIRVAKADEVLTQEEVIYVKSVAIKLGITSSEFNEITLNLERFVTTPPSTPEGKMRQLYDILTLMALDMTAHPEEEALCNEIGKMIGFSEVQVKKAIALTKENLDEVVTQEQIAAIVN